MCRKLRPAPDLILRPPGFPSVGGLSRYSYSQNYICATTPWSGYPCPMRRLVALMATVALSTAPVASADPTVDPTPPPIPSSSSTDTGSTDTGSAVPSTDDGTAPPPADENTGTEVSPPSTGDTAQPSSPDDTGSPPVQTPPDTPPAEENPPSEPPHDNIPVATPPSKHDFLERLLKLPHYTSPVESAATGQNIPIAQCHRVRSGNKSTPGGGSPSRARSHVSC